MFNIIKLTAVSKDPIPSKHPDSLSNFILIDRQE